MRAALRDIAALLLLVLPLVAQENNPAAAALESALDMPRGDLDLLHRAWLKEHGAFAPLLERLAKTDSVAARWVEARTYRAQGNLPKALALFKTLAADGDDEARWKHAQLLDANAKPKRAQKAYEALASGSSVYAARAKLRLALVDKKGDALLAYAKAQDDADVRRATAILLGLIGRPQDAAQLYEARGTGSQRFREEVRIAQWQLQAKKFEEARNAAWRALRVAPIARDRRYALALLIEAHREEKSLDTLIEQFATAKDLPVEARDAWVNLLRERSRVDEAMRLLRQDSNGSLTTDMRRDLLDLCREAGRDQLVVESYRGLMLAEPRVYEWPTGLARYHLERGEVEKAETIWTDVLRRSSEPADVLSVARAAMALGLDRVAETAAERAATADDTRYDSLLLLFDLYRNRGRMADAEEQLTRIDRAAPKDHPARLALAEAYEGTGAKRRAADILLALRTARGAEKSEEDVDMRLAVLLAEVGDDEAALRLWRELWEKANTVPRRTYVEDRLLTVASRLGVLADIAIDLEEKLIAGEVSNREAGLLVKIYTKAGDAVSAAEVIQEHVKKSGGTQLKTLSEKARVYLANSDYYNYELTLRALMAIDPDGKREYLRHLAMSNLERGQPHEARRTLSELKTLDDGRDSAEFEAGVLALAGLENEAMVAYRRGLAQYPDRIEVYLLLAELMVKKARKGLAIGMFQHLAENADKDDMFTVAIDGLLNVDAGRPVLRWARRLTLARLAGRPDKNYLYQLYADLSEELADKKGMVRAADAALPSAGQRRGAMLRELVELSAPKQSNSYVIVGGVAVRRSSGGSSEDQLRYGRRLLQLRELVPPGVYLDLGRAFLSADDVASAEQTFSSARDVPDYAAFQRQVAQTFEEAGFLGEARRVYARLLLSEATDIELLAKVAELHEATGTDDRARALYVRALELMLSRRPLSVVKADPKDDDPWARYWAANVTEFDQHYDRVLQGMLATIEDASALLTRQRARVTEDHARLQKPEAELAKHPRLRDRARYHRRVAFATGRIADADTLDRTLLTLFAKDAGLLEALVKERLDWGLVLSARNLVEKSQRPEKERARLRFLFAGRQEGEVTGVLRPEEATRLFLPLLLRGEDEHARKLLRSVAFTGVSERDLEIAPRLVAVAVYLRDADATLTFGRHWLAALLRHGKAREVQLGVTRVFQECFVALDAAQRVSLARSLADLVLRDPKKAGSVLYTLGIVQQAVKEPLFDAEQIKTLLKEGGGMMFVYQPSALMATVPESDRVDVLRELWTKVPKNYRGNFVFNLLQGTQEPLSEPVRKFVLEKYHATVDELDLKRFGYLIQNGILRNRVNSATALVIATDLRKRHPDDVLVRICYTAALWHAGEREKARPLARAIIREQILGEHKDARLNWPLRQFKTELGADANRMALEVVEAEEARNGATTQTTNERLTLLQQERDPERMLAAIRKAIADHPKTEAYKSRLANQYAMLGRALDSLLLLEELHKAAPKNKNYRQRLVAGWKALRNPERAARFEENEDEAVQSGAKPKKKPKKKPSARKVSAANVVEIKRAVEAGDETAARLLWRRLWRNFQVRRRAFTPYGNWQLNSLMMQRWPRPSSGERKLSRGGIPLQQEEQAKSNLPQPAVLAIAELPFGGAELARHVRTLDASELDRAALLFDGLAHAAARTVGREQAIRQTAALLRSGDARKADSAVLLKLLEDEPKPGTESRALLKEIVGAVNAYDYEAARRLARVHARTGAAREAAVLYRWCATQLHSSTDYYSRPDARKLIEECVESLSGDDRLDVIELVLKSARPTLQRYFRQDNQDALEIRTWTDVLGAKAALERARELCVRAAGKPSPQRRQSARAAAILFAGAGEYDNALRALINGIGRLDPAKIERPKTRYYYFNPSQFQPQYLSSDAMLKLFPVGAGKEWCLAASEALAGWIGENVIEGRTATRLQSLLAVRLHAAGESETAQWLVGQAEQRAVGDPSTRVWVLDAWRALGNEDRASAIERDLLEQHRLPLARVLEALTRIESKDKAAAAALRKKLSAYTALDRLS